MKMTQEQAESRILELAQEMKKVIAEYYPKDGYLHVSIQDEYIGFNNRYWKREKSKKGIINYNTILGSYNTND